MSKRSFSFRIDQSHYALVVRRPVAIMMVTLAVAVFGWVSYQRLALTLMPDMSYPTLTVRTSYPGTAPEEMENVISRPLEQQLGIIPKLVSISSISKAAQSDVILEFQWKTDMDLVAQEVREKIDRIRFPQGAERPLLLHFDPSLDPILRVGLAGPQSLYELRHLADHEVKRKLETIPGVAAIQIKGGLEEQFLVALDEAKLSMLKLDIGQIATRLQQGNVNMSGGNLREGQTEYLIRTLNEFRTLEEIGTLIIARQNNVDIRLRDIATVRRYHEDRQVITRVNGHESVEIEVYKEADANVLVVAAAVKDAIFGTAAQQAYVEQQKHPQSAAKASSAASPPRRVKSADRTNRKRTSKRESAMEQMQQARNSAQALITHREQTDFLSYQLPPGSSLQLLSDQSVFISNSIDEVKKNALFGGFIAIGVLFLFLRNATQTLIVSLCIPISILATFAPMYMSGVSLNIISLGGLALGVGNLVDNAIVVLESIFRCREEGDDAVTAVVRGTSEVAMPVVASTLTTVAVFFPIVFVEGVAGQVFGDMALAVVFSQIASLIAALYLIPMLASKAATVAGSIGSAAANSPGGTQGAEDRSIVAQLRSGGFLQFPTAPSERVGRFVHPWRLIVIVLARIAVGLAIVFAALVKAAAAILAVALSPIIGLVGRFADRARTLDAGALNLGPSSPARESRDKREVTGAYSPPLTSRTTPIHSANTAWARLAGWFATDRLRPISSDRMWPGMLSFTALGRLSAGLATVWSWLIARRWRWIGLLVLPAIAVAVILLARRGVVVPASTGPMMRGMIAAGTASVLAAKPWYLSLWHWCVVQPWWLLVLLFIPGAIPAIFVFARAVIEILLRLVASVLQSVVLVVVQALIGIARALALILSPVAGLALGAFERGNNALQNHYPRVLTTALRHRFVVLAAAFGALAASVVFVVPRLGSDLIPQVQQGEFNLDVTLPIGTPLERTGEVAETIDAVVRAQPEVERTAITVGAEESASTSIDAGEHTARLTVRLKGGLEDDAETLLIDRIRQEFRSLPEVKLEISYPALFSFKSPIEVEVRGHDLGTLKRLSNQAESVLAASVPGLVDIRSTLQAGHPEIQVVYNRDRLAEYGLSLRNVAELVRNKIQGRAATQFRQEDQLIDIVVRLREEDRFGLAELRGLIVNPDGAVPIPLSAIADLTVNEGPSEIRRVDQQRTALIMANIRGADLATVSKDIVAAMETITYPPGFSYALAGQNAEMKTSLNSLLLAFGLAVFLVYIVMASQFESLVQPLLIMMTVPLALIGVVWVLWLTAIPVTIMVFLGLIILVGIVVNNAIVLIDYINTLRGRGMEKTEAIIEGGRARLRPILMTATTTIVGLIPMALGIGEGAEIRAPMAITVIVGLSTATLLTLVVIPTLYSQFTSNRTIAAPPDAADRDREPQAESEPVPLAK